MNPLDALKADIESIPARVQLAVEISLARVAAVAILNHLRKLDPSRQAGYSAALQALGED